MSPSSLEKTIAVVVLALLITTLVLIRTAAAATPAEQACSEAIEQGYYTPELLDQCLADYVDSLEQP